MWKLNNKFQNYYLQNSKKLNWSKKPKKIIKVLKGNRYVWFPDGKINLYQNCISDHIKKNKNKTAIITVNDNKKIAKYSYLQIDKKVNHMSSYLLKVSKKNIDFKVMIHASASIEAAVIMLACSKIGLHFSVIFQELESIGIHNRIKLFKPSIFFSRLNEDHFKKRMNYKINFKVKYIFKDQIKNIINNKKK